MAFPQKRGRGRAGSSNGGRYPKRRKTVRAQVAKLGRELRVKTQYNYYRHHILGEELPTTPYVIQCTNPASWVQTFDIAFDTTDQKLPSINLKSIGYDMLFEVGQSHRATSFTVFYCGLTKAGMGYFGGSITGANMVAGQSYSAGNELNAMLNKSLFRIFKTYRFSIGEHTMTSNQVAFTHNLENTKKRIYHRDRINTQIFDTVTGWTAATDQNLTWDQKRYWIIFQNNVLGSPDTNRPKIHYQQMATVCY